jgi:hypothetical protein
MAREYANDATTALNGGISSGATTITVDSAANFPSSGEYMILVGTAPNLELMLVTGGQGTTTWTVTRGAEDASRWPAFAHLDDAPVHEILTRSGLLNIPETQGNYRVGGFLGIGTAPVSTSFIIQGGEITGAATLVANTFEADVRPSQSSSTIYGVVSNPTLRGTNAATTNTISNLHVFRGSFITNADYDPAITTASIFRAVTPTLGGAGTLTTLHGYYSDLDHPLTGITTAWQLYMAGTAPSYFGGKVTIGSSSVPTALLSVQGNITNDSAIHILPSWTLTGNDKQMYTLGGIIVPGAAIGGQTYMVRFGPWFQGTEGNTTNTIATFNVFTVDGHFFTSFDANIGGYRNFNCGMPNLTDYSATISSFYGYYSSVSTNAKITNVWQLYMDGNAPSYFAGTIRFNPMAAPGSPVAGEWWYESTRKSFYFQTAAGSLGLSGIVYANTASSTAIASTASETNFSTTYTFPANSLTVGAVVEVWASGFWSTHSTGTLSIILRLKLGSVNLLVSDTVTGVASMASRRWYIHGFITVRTIGSSGTMRATGEFRIPNANNDTGAVWSMKPANADATINTTTTQVLQVSAQHGASQANNTITLDQLVVKVHG